jgi:ergothioneine biosynthesis protein EgtB
MLTDLKHLFWCNPLRPVYRETVPAPLHSQGPGSSWITCPGGTCRIGHEGAEFAYDNELPRHHVLVEPYLLAGGLVTNGEYLEFMQDHAYERPELWLSDGWRTVQERQWRCPLYWEEVDGRWRYMTLSGMQDLDPARPVCHVSYYEADAFARWAGARLPRESEWEIIAETVPITGNFVESGHLQPVPPEVEEPRATPWQMFGDVWQWTASPYMPYPGYRQAPGPLGEYNGKFMCNQLVLRGGSCATSVTHIRPTYRNFFPPEARWQFSGIRLAKDA